MSYVLSLYPSMPSIVKSPNLCPLLKVLELDNEAFHVTVLSVTVYVTKKTQKTLKLQEIPVSVAFTWCALPAWMTVHFGFHAL